MDSKKESKSKRSHYVLSRGNNYFYFVTESGLKKLSRQDALSMCAITWLELHRLLKTSAVLGEDLYLNKGKTKVKIIDGMTNALDKLNIIHPSIIEQIKELNLVNSGFKIHCC